MMFEPDFIALLGCSVLTLVFAAMLGYFLDQLRGALPLFVMAVTAVTFCLIGTLLAGWIGLSGAALLVASLAFVAGFFISGTRGARSFSLLWLGWFAFCSFGYLAAGLAGLLLITLPGLALFWVGAYSMAQYLLPISDDVSHHDRLQAFRVWLTYALGTNYPYYIVERQQKILRARGDIFRYFLAGPGVVVTGCDHAVVTSDGMTVRDIKPPGLSFTGRAETIADVIDLRLQQRMFDVRAASRDSIYVRVRTVVAFRIHAGSNQPAPGQSLPFRRSAILNAVMQGQPIQHSRGEQAGEIVRRQNAWDNMVSIVAAHCVRRVIGEYMFDELCVPDRPAGEAGPAPPERVPRQEIAQRLQQEWQRELEPYGIQVVGGGIGDLMPEDRELLQQRVDNWHAELQRKIARQMGESEAEYIQMVESARARAQARMIETISSSVRQAGGAGGDISTDVLALRFVEALEKMMASPSVRQTLPPSFAEAIAMMRRSVEGEPPEAAA